MQINKKVKLQKQTIEGTVSMTLPKQILNVIGWKPGDIITVTLDSNNETIITLSKEV